MTVAIPHYSGWRPRSMRVGRGGSSDAQSSGKRTRLSKAKSDRILYCSAKGYKQNPRRYKELCDRADQLNGRRSS